MQGLYCMLSEGAFWGELLLVLPLYIANAGVLLVMKKKLLGPLHRLDQPVSERLFGKNRPVLCAVVIFFLVVAGYYALLGRILVLPAAGMLAMTHASSLIKRRIGLEEGSSAPLLDQLDFFIGGVAGLALSGIYLPDLPLLLALTVAIHFGANTLAYKAGLKNVWW